VSGPNVRISLASCEADLAAVVWPGLSGVCCPSMESAGQVQRIEEVIGHYERLRGMRPGTVAIQPFIETARGVANAYDIASSSPRIEAFGPGPKLYLQLDVEPAPEGEALLYARSECELVARTLGLEPVATQYLAD
jgi:citrate lyase subunit beta / citryl-CoA lyase